MRLRPAHRARRLASALLGSGPGPDEERWARSWLSEAEGRFFDEMRPMDRRHAIAVARAVEEHTDGEPPRWVMAAALMHDVGKNVPGLGAYGRVVATLSGWVGGADMAEHWADTTGFTRRVGLYLQYPRLGAELLAVNGSDPRVVAWSREHHDPEETWSIPAEVGRMLVAADDGTL